MSKNKMRKMVLLMVVMVFSLTFLSSCSKKIVFNTSTVAPAARGFVKVKKDRNANYMIDVSISNLAEIERLQGDNKTYVVWMLSDGQVEKNIGQIQSGTKMVSKRLSASFNSVSSSKPSKVFVTAEKDGTVQYSGGTVVLTTDNF